MNTTKRWTGMVLLVCLGVAARAPRQTLPPGPGAAPTPEPLPCAPSGTGVPQPLIPPSSSGMMDSPLSLPGDTPNAFVKPPAHDDHNQLYFGFEYLLWFANKDQLPVVVTTTSADPPDIAAV